MSRMIKRIGTKQQAFSYEVTIHSLSLSLVIPVRIALVWRRRKKRVETKISRALSPSVGSVEIEETLTMINTLYQEASGKFQRKKALLSVQASVEDGDFKQVGQVSVDLSDYFTKPMQKVKFPLEMCRDKDAFIILSVKADFIKDNPVLENQCQISRLTEFSIVSEYDAQLFEQDLNQLRYSRNSRPKQTIKNCTNDNTEIQQLKEENAQLCFEKEVLEREIVEIMEKNRNTKRGLVKHIKDLDEENSVLRKHLESTIKKFKTKKDELKSLKQEYSKYTNTHTEQPERKENRCNENIKLSATQSESIKHLEDLVSDLQDTISLQRNQLKEQALLIEGLSLTAESVKKDNSEMQKQLEKTKKTDLSNSAYVFMQEKVSGLTSKLNTKQTEYEREVSALKTKIESLENQMNTKNIREQQSVGSTSEGDLLEELNSARKEANELRGKLSLMNQDFVSNQNKYIEAKMGWANSEFEREQMYAKMVDAQTQLRNNQQAYKEMETEFCRLSDRFGESVNYNNELEGQIQMLQTQLHTNKL